MHSSLCIRIYKCFRIHENSLNYVLGKTVWYMLNTNLNRDSFYDLGGLLFKAG